MKHVLQVILVYHMMFLRSPTSLAKKLIALSLVFLWKAIRMGGKRIPLDAWEKLSRPKVDGGVGLKDFRSHSDPLLSKWFTSTLGQPGVGVGPHVCGEPPIDQMAKL